MQVLPLEIPDVKLIRPRVFADERGFFLEAWNARAFAAAGIGRDFVQLNHSRSRRGTLRGLHFQWTQPQGKLVRALSGVIHDVAVDLRPGSPHFGRWTARRLDAADHELLWIPEGFAHGFCVLSETADFEYLCSDYYRPEDEGVLRWNDPALAIDWPLAEPQLSEKDATAPGLAELLPRLQAPRT
jgi:dTDP-4-dehydrorhamnose 3,5-epimerase